MSFAMQFPILLAVALGGAFGSLLRHNITGGFLMGVIVELGALKLNLTPEVRAFLTVGVLGGYTTFSTFSLDSVLLLQRGAYAAAGLYIVGSVALSIAALIAGLQLVRAL